MNPWNSGQLGFQHSTVRQHSAECPGPQWDHSMCEVTPVTHGQDSAKGAGLGSSSSVLSPVSRGRWSLQTEAAEMWEVFMPVKLAWLWFYLEKTDQICHRVHKGAWMLKSSAAMTRSIFVELALPVDVKLHFSLDFILLYCSICISNIRFGHGFRIIALSNCMQMEWLDIDIDILACFNWLLYQRMQITNHLEVLDPLLCTRIFPCSLAVDWVLSS